jgi:hypothetical protein
MITEIFDDNASSCDELDFYAFGTEHTPKPFDLPNIGKMGIVTLSEPDEHGDRTVLSTRPFTQPELAVEWAVHQARHALA